MKMKTLVDAVPSIKKIANEELPMGTLYKVKRILDKLESHLAFYDEKRQSILEKYCDVEDGRYVPKEECAERLENEMRELLDVELDMEGIQKLKLKADDSMRLSYADLCALKEFIEFEFTEEE